jgi:PTS system ascorbate-specific IIB component
MADILKVLTVCGAGVGTSTLLRVNVQETFKSFSLPGKVHVENTSMSRAKGTQCDVIITFESFASEARSFCPSVIVINNLMDMKELKAKIGTFLKEKNLIE